MTQTACILKQRWLRVDFSGERSVSSDWLPGGAAVSAVRGAGEAGAEAGRVAGHRAEDGVAGEGAGLRAGPPAQLQQHLHRPRAPNLPAHHSGERDLSLSLSWIFSVVLCSVECGFYDVMLCSVRKACIADWSSHYKT